MLFFFLFFLQIISIKFSNASCGTGFPETIKISSKPIKGIIIKKEKINEGVYFHTPVNFYKYEMKVTQSWNKNQSKNEIITLIDEGNKEGWMPSSFATIQEEYKSLEKKKNI